MFNGFIAAMRRQAAAGRANLAPLPGMPLWKGLATCRRYENFHPGNRHQATGRRVAGRPGFIRRYAAIVQKMRPQLEKHTIRQYSIKIFDLRMEATVELFSGLEWGGEVYSRRSVIGR